MSIPVKIERICYTCPKCGLVIAYEEQPCPMCALRVLCAKKDEALKAVRKIVVTNSWEPYDLSDIVNSTNQALALTDPALAGKVLCEAKELAGLRRVRDLFIAWDNNPCRIESADLLDNVLQAALAALHQDL